MIELYYKHAPRTCLYVASLADSGHYNGTTFHRVIRDFMVQGGEGAESIDTAVVADEITGTLKHTGAGVVSMAASAGSSQFFVTLKPAPFLDGKHTVIGRIHSGMSVVQRMGMVATDDQDRPREPIAIHCARAFRGAPEMQQQHDGNKELVFVDDQ